MISTYQFLQINKICIYIFHLDPDFLVDQSLPTSIKHFDLYDILIVESTEINQLKDEEKVQN